MGPHGAAGGKTNFHSTDKKYSGVLLLLPGKKYTGVKHGRGGGKGMCNYPVYNKIQNNNIGTKPRANASQMQEQRQTIQD